MKGFFFIQQGKLFQVENETSTSHRIRKQCKMRISWEQVFYMYLINSTLKIIYTLLNNKWKMYTDNTAMKQFFRIA